jgi:hypothetical protein
VLGDGADAEGQTYIACHVTGCYDTQEARVENALGQGDNDRHVRDRQNRIQETRAQMRWMTWQVISGRPDRYHCHRRAAALERPLNPHIRANHEPALRRTARVSQ